jgi:predicted metal-dependent hydrolase
MFGLPQLELPFFWNKPAAPENKAKNGSRSRSSANPAAMPPEEPRSVHLGGREIRYVVRRSAKRRTLSLTVDTRGLRVAAPLRARQSDIDKLIYDNTRWVLAALSEWQQPAHLAARDWRPGDALSLLGVTRPLRVAPGRTGLAKFDDVLILTVKDPQDEAVVRAKLRDALKAEARVLFAQRLAHYAKSYGVATPELRLSQAETRWGSCARDRTGQHRISLNWRMIHMEQRLIDYVVAHEIAHVKHMHHGPRFWAAVGKLYPDYVNIRDEIKRRAKELPNI